MTDVKKTDRQKPEPFKVEITHPEKLSSEELEKASGGGCWFYHSCTVLEDSYHPEGYFRKSICKDCGEILYHKDGKKISREEYERVRNDGRSMWGIWG